MVDLARICVIPVTIRGTRHCGPHASGDVHSAAHSGSFFMHGERFLQNVPSDARRSVQSTVIPAV